MSGIVPLSSWCGERVTKGQRAALTHCKLIRFVQLQLPTVSRRITVNCATQTADHAQPSSLVVGVDLGTTNSAVAVSLAMREACSSLASL